MHNSQRHAIKLCVTCIDSFASGAHGNAFMRADSKARNNNVVNQNRCWKYQLPFWCLPLDFYLILWNHCVPMCLFIFNNRSRRNQSHNRWHSYVFYLCSFSFSLFFTPHFYFHLSSSDYSKGTPPLQIHKICLNWDPLIIEAIRGNAQHTHKSESDWHAHSIHRN